MAHTGITDVDPCHDICWGVLQTAIQAAGKVDLVGTAARSELNKYASQDDEVV